MRILVVSPYAPIRDGIASYAVQQVKALRAEGHDVEVLSPQPSAAHHHLDLRSLRGPLALAKRVRGYDRVVVQYHPDVFYVEGAWSLWRIPTTAGLLAVAAAARSLEVLVHEIDYDLGHRGGIDSVLARAFWRRVDRLTVHTEAEAQRLEEAYRLPAGTVEVVDHGSHFVRRTELDQAAARRRLGLAVEGHVFLSIGFIQPHKGFDRAVRAFRGFPPQEASLHVVGSVRVEDDQYLEHLDDLRAEVDATPGAFLHDAYVSDELFDVWLIAADTVVLPYRHIWSSSVLERAALYDRAIIATRVGGLAAQAPEGTVLVDTDDELARAMSDALVRHLGPAAEAPEALSAWPSPGEVPEGRRTDGDGVEGGGAEGDGAEGDSAGGDSAEGGGADREAVQAAVVDRARVARGRPLADEVVRRNAPGSVRRRPGRSLDRLEPLVLPPPTSTRPLMGLVKRAVLVLTGWVLNPIVERINQLQRATADALADHRHLAEADLAEADLVEADLVEDEPVEDR